MKRVRRGVRLAASIGVALLLAGSGAAVAAGVPVKWYLAVAGANCGEVVAAELPVIAAPAQLPAGARPPAQPLSERVASFRFAGSVIKCQPLYQWLSAATQGTVNRVDVSITAADYNSQLVLSTSFFQAAVTQIEVPALDVSGKDLGTLQVRFESSSTRHMSMQGPVPATLRSLPVAGGAWTTSGYRLVLGALDGKAVTHIDPLTIRMAVSPGVPMARVAANLQFVVEGQAAVEAYARLASLQAKPGAPLLPASLELLAPNGKVVYTFVFPDVSITKFASGRDAKGLNGTVTLSASRVYIQYAPQ